MAGDIVASEVRLAARPVPPPPPEGLTFKVHKTYRNIPESYRSNSAMADHEWHFSPPAVTAHWGKDPAIAGHIAWSPYGNNVSKIHVEPEHQGKGVANALYDFAKTNVNPKLDHSWGSQTPEGEDWAHAEADRGVWKTRGRPQR